MDIFEALLTRRSIRQYTEEPISDDDLRTVLNCAMLAPSAKNEQPWHFVVVRDASKRQELSNTTPYTHMAAQAPVVIVVCGDLNEQKSEGFWPQDCAAAIENLLLAARGKNLGTVWCGIYPVEERVQYLKKALRLPEGIIPLGMVCLGHPARDFKQEDRFRQERVHLEEW